MANTAYHMVHYRRFVQSDLSKTEEKQTLEQLCRNALNTDDQSVPLWQRPQDRILNLDGDISRQIFLNKVADLSSAVFGEMCLVQAQDMQTILNLTTSEVKLSEVTNAVVYDLDERKAPKGSQFVRGMAYWLAVGDHTFFVKTHSMTPDLIRSYFDWMFKIRGAILPSQSTISLNAEFDRTTGAKDIGDIRSLRVSGFTGAEFAVSPTQEGTTKEVATSRLVRGKTALMQQAIPVVEALFGAEKTKSLLESLGPKEYLAVDAAVKIRGSRTEHSKAKLQNIANELADLTDAKVQIDGKDGKLVDGDAILRTKMPFNLPYEGSNLLEFDNVADQLQEVYSRFVKDGKIPA